MAKTLSRPFFSLQVLAIAVLVIAAGVLVSQGLVAALRSLLFR